MFAVFAPLSLDSAAPCSFAGSAIAVSIKLVTVAYRFQNDHRLICGYDDLCGLLIQWKVL